MKTLKFRPYLVPEVLEGRKTSTWRLFDEKDLTVGDRVELINWQTGEKFGEAELTDVREKPIRDMTEADSIGHEKFSSPQAMVQAFKIYYGDKVRLDTLIKIVDFKLL